MFVVRTCVCYTGGMADSADVARQGHYALELVHGVVYLTPETGERLVALGLEPGRITYFAGRAAAMGAVSAAVVTATFTNFNPTLVASCIPRAWTLASPEAIAGARFDGADAELHRLWGGEVIRSGDLVEAADLARRATEGCETMGRPLFAAHAGLDWPSEPHLVLWHAATLLREYRGDGHTAALVSVGLSGIEALVTHTATGTGFTPEFARTRRGWSVEDWERAEAGLADRGLLTRDHRLTPEGEAMRHDVEARTDELASKPWALLGHDRAGRLGELGRRLSGLIIEGEPQLRKPFAAGSPLFGGRH